MTCSTRLDRLRFLLRLAGFQLLNLHIDIICTLYFESMSCNSFHNLKIREQIYMNEVYFELDLKIFTTGLRRNILTSAEVKARDVDN